jgi:hypothetical protein
MSRPKSKYKQFEVVSPYTMYGAVTLNVRKTKKVISCITNSPNRTMELLARQFVKIPRDLEINALILHQRGAMKQYRAKIKAGLDKAFDAGAKVVKVRAMPAEIFKDKVVIKELRPADDKKIIQLVKKVVAEEAA